MLEIYEQERHSREDQSLQSILWRETKETEEWNFTMSRSHEKHTCAL